MTPRSLSLSAAIAGLFLTSSACVDWSSIAKPPAEGEGEGEGGGGGEGEREGEGEGEGEGEANWTLLPRDTNDIVRSVSRSAGRVFVVGSKLQEFVDDSLVEHTAPCGTTMVGPVHVDVSTGDLYVGLLGGVGRVSTGGACKVFKNSLAEDRDAVGMAVGDFVVIWDGTSLRVVDADDVAVGSPTTLLLIDRASRAELIELDDAIVVVLGAPVDDVDGTRSRQAFSFAKANLLADVPTLVSAPMPAADVLVPPAEGVATSATLVPVVANVVAVGNNARALNVVWQGTTVVNDFSLYGGPLNDPAGDVVTAFGVDPSLARVHLAGPAGLLLTVENSNTVVSRGSPRDGFVKRFVVDQGSGDVWGLGDDVVYFWTQESARLGAPPDDRVRVQTGDAVGAVGLSSLTGERQLMLRDDRNFRLLTAGDRVITVSAALTVGDNPALSSGSGDLALREGSLVEVLVRPEAERAPAVQVLTRRFNQALSGLSQPLVVDVGAPCGVADPDCILDVNVTVDGGMVAFARRGEVSSTGATVELNRCDLTTTSATCVTASFVVTVSQPTGIDLRVDLDGVIVGTMDGLIVSWSPETGAVPVVHALAGAQPGIQVRRLGDCLLTALPPPDRELEIGDARADRFAGSASRASVDGFVRDLVVTDTDTTDTTVNTVNTTVIAGGGATAGGGSSAAQLYQVGVDAANCAFTSSTASAIGHQRSQADLMGVAVRADGAIVVADKLNRVWLVP